MPRGVSSQESSTDLKNNKIKSKVNSNINIKTNTKTNTKNKISKAKGQTGTIDIVTVDDTVDVTMVTIDGSIKANSLPTAQPKIGIRSHWFKQNALRELPMIRLWKSHCNILDMMKDRHYNLSQIETCGVRMTCTQVKQEFAAIQAASVVYAAVEEYMIMQPFSFVLNKVDGSVSTTRLPRLDQVTAAMSNVGSGGEEGDEELIVCDDSNTLRFKSTPSLEIDLLGPADVAVVYCWRQVGAFGIHAINELLAYQKVIRCAHMIVVMHHVHDPHHTVTNPSAVKMALQTSHDHTNSFFTEWFTLAATQYNPTHTVYHDTMVPIPTSALQKFNFPAHKLETLLSNDRMTNHYGFSPGTVVQMINPDSKRTFMHVSDQ